MWKYRCSGVVIIHLSRLLKWVGNNLSVQVHTDSKNITFFAGPCWWQNMRIVLIMGISEVILEMGQTWSLYNSMENCCYWYRVTEINEKDYEKSVSGKGSYTSPVVQKQRAFLRVEMIDLWNKFPRISIFPSLEILKWCLALYDMYLFYMCMCVRQSVFQAQITYPELEGTTGHHWVRICSRKNLCFVTLGIKVDYDTVKNILLWWRKSISSSQRKPFLIWERLKCQQHIRYDCIFSFSQSFLLAPKWNLEWTSTTRNVCSLLVCRATAHPVMLRSYEIYFLTTPWRWPLSCEAFSSYPSNYCGVCCIVLNIYIPKTYALIF